MRYDIAIVGTGPAGLEAALTAVNRNKSILLFGNAGLSPKVEKAHEVRNYLGLPQVAGKDMQRAFSEQIAQEGIIITEETITQIYAMGDFFALQGNDATQMYEASTVILATGLAPAKTLPGEDAFLGRGVSYCATCDGTLYRDKNVAVIGYSAKEEKEADFLAEICASVTYFPQYAEEVHTCEKVQVLREKNLVIGGELSANRIESDQGTHPFDGIFILRDSIAPDKLVPGLEIENNHVKVNADMSTNLPGLFAAGDVTGTPYQFIKAAGQGNVAALSAVSYL